MGNHKLHDLLLKNQSSSYQSQTRPISGSQTNDLLSEHQTQPLFQKEPSVQQFKDYKDRMSSAHSRENKYLAMGTSTQYIKNLRKQKEMFQKRRNNQLRHSYQQRVSHIDKRESEFAMQFNAQKNFYGVGVVGKIIDANDLKEMQSRQETEDLVRDILRREEKKLLDTKKNINVDLANALKSRVSAPTALPRGGGEDDQDDELLQGLQSRLGAQLMPKKSEARRASGQPAADSKAKEKKSSKKSKSSIQTQNIELSESDEVKQLCNRFFFNEMGAGAASAIVPKRRGASRKRESINTTFDKGSSFAFNESIRDSKHNTRLDKLIFQAENHMFMRKGSVGMFEPSL